MNILTIKDIQVKYKVTRQTIGRWRREENMPFIKIGGSVRFEEEKINEWIRKKNEKEYKN